MTTRRRERIGWAVATDSAGPVTMVNDVGGTDFLPHGSYRVRIVKGWDDYETGRRLVGELLDPSDVETARKVGTTGFTPESFAERYGRNAGIGPDVRRAAKAFNPKRVYFSGSNWMSEAELVAEKS